MKKYLALLLLLAAPLWAADTLTTEDSAGIFRRTKATTIGVTANQIATANSVAAAAVVGSTTNNGVVGTVIKTTTGGALDGSFLTGTRYGTNIFLSGNATIAAAAIYTNVLTYTTTFGSNSVVMVNASMAMKGNGDNQIGRLVADGFTPVDNTSDAASVGNYGTSEHPSRYSQIFNLVSNVTIHLQVKTVAGTGATVYQHVTSAGTGSPTVSNATYLSILELR
jgi:hypothetical protein